MSGKLRWSRTALVVVALAVPALTVGLSHARPLVVTQTWTNARPVVLTGFLRYANDADRMTVIAARKVPGGVSVTFVDLKASGLRTRVTVERSIVAGGTLELFTPAGDILPSVRMDVVMPKAGRIVFESTSDNWDDGFILPFNWGTAAGSILFTDHPGLDHVPSPPNTIGRGEAVGTVDGVPIVQDDSTRVHYSTTATDLLLAITVP